MFEFTCAQLSKKRRWQYLAHKALWEHWFRKFLNSDRIDYLVSCFGGLAYFVNRSVGGTQFQKRLPRTPFSLVFPCLQNCSCWQGRSFQNEITFSNRKFSFTVVRMLAYISSLWAWHSRVWRLSIKQVWWREPLTKRVKAFVSCFVKDD